MAREKYDKRCYILLLLFDFYHNFQFIHGEEDKKKLLYFRLVLYLFPTQPTTTTTTRWDENYILRHEVSFLEETFFYAYWGGVSRESRVLRKNYVFMEWLIDEKILSKWFVTKLPRIIFARLFFWVDYVFFSWEIRLWEWFVNMLDIQHWTCSLGNGYY